jgi:hypothetical protein
MAAADIFNPLLNLLNGPALLRDDSIPHRGENSEVSGHTRAWYSAVKEFKSD